MSRRAARAPRYFKVLDDTMLDPRGHGPRKGDFYRAEAEEAGPVEDGAVYACRAMADDRLVVGRLFRRGRGYVVAYDSESAAPEPFGEGELLVLGRVTEFYRAEQMGSGLLACRRPAPLYEAGGSVTWGTNAYGTAGWASPNWYEQVGGSPADWKDGGWLKRLHPDDRQRAFAAWVSALYTGEPYQTTLRFSAHGTYRWTAVLGRPIRDEQGRIREWRGVMQLREEAEGEKTA
jgi:PAS domain-containing protein